jgi:hypothetical protein
VLCVLSVRIVCPLQADVYSFGVTLWEGVERRRPWAGLDGMQLWTMWVSDPTGVKLQPLSVREAAGKEAGLATCLCLCFRFSRLEKFVHACSTAASDAAVHAQVVKLPS